jgi:hypothetical protein
MITLKGKEINVKEHPSVYETSSSSLSQGEIPLKKLEDKRVMFDISDIEDPPYQNPLLEDSKFLRMRRWHF